MEHNLHMDTHSITISIGGRTITFESGTIARQADSAVVVQSGDTLLLSTVCKGTPLPEVDFLPLKVDYQEKFSSTGKTLGGFIKREGKPTEKEILTCRLIDRPIRPMFEEGYYVDTHLVTTVLSYDGETQTEPLAICGISAALTLSDIPFIKPVGAVRVGMIEKRFIINPTLEEMKDSTLDLVLAGTEDAILMIEGYCNFLTEDQIMNATEEGHEAIKIICQKLSEWQQVIGKPKNKELLRPKPQELLTEVEAIMAKPLQDAIRTPLKSVRETALKELRNVVIEKLVSETNPQYLHHDVEAAIKKVIAHHMRQMILKENKRCDGRTPENIRPIHIDMGLLPRTHGSSLFTRGETQSIAVCTLGGETMGQRYEDLNSDGIRRFYLQYTFPSYCVGEVGKTGFPSRREIGHGKLAERALTATIPNKDDFPYTIRLESNITESNGSSSMASVCGGCLAMMEAGVPIKRPIAGIAMGLILEEEHYVVLSDILSVEDALGDMDFKVAGDTRGITALQLDIKVEGITKQIMKMALAQAKRGYAHILNKMREACPKPKENLSQYAPRIKTIKVKPSQVGSIIGPGGKQIRAIIEETGVDINIEDDGNINIASTSKKGMERACQIIYDLTAEVEIGKVYKGKIVTIKDFGMFIAILNVQGLCHISEISHSRIKSIRDHYKEGDTIDVIVLDIDKNGRISLSHKALLKKPPTKT